MLFLQYLFFLEGAVAVVVNLFIDVGSRHIVIGMNMKL